MNFLIDSTESFSLCKSLNFLVQVRKIQDNLKRNKAMYDEERLREWRERKLMYDEDVRLKTLYLQE
jgi:hypothetical protein